LKEAAHWYQRSAASGFAISQFRLGTMGVAKDIARAKICYSRAAEQGKVKAMHNLAVLIASRSGPAPDAEAKKHRDGLKATLSAADAEEATAQADTWQAKRPKPMANDSHVAGQAWLRPRTNNR
jgi:TPR repeat protein